MPLAIVCHLRGFSLSALASTRRQERQSSGSSAVGAGTEPASSYSRPLCTISVASPPSSSSMFGPFPPGQVSACSVHHQYSSSVSPFQAKTGTPRGSLAVPFRPTATAAAAWSCVEKMLHEAQRTSAPRSSRVSIRTAVWMVMCSEPEMRAPESGLAFRYSSRSFIRPGISTSASSISFRPHSARARSLTLKSRRGDVAVLLMGMGVTRGGASSCLGSSQHDRFDALDAHGQAAARQLDLDLVARPEAEHAGSERRAVRDALLAV